MQTTQQITITPELEIGNPAEVLQFLNQLSEPEHQGIFIPTGTQPDSVGSYTLKAVSGMSDELIDSEQWLLLGTAEYWLLLWQQAKAHKAEMESSGDPEDVHPDGVHLYYTLEDLSLGFSPCP